MSNNGRLVFIIGSVVVGVLLAFGWMMFGVKRQMTIVDDFGRLKESVAMSADQFGRENEWTQLEIKLKIREETEAEAMQSLRTDFEEARGIVRKLKEAIQGHVVEMEKIGGKLTEEDKLTKYDEVENSSKYWMGTDPNANEAGGNGAAYLFKKQLKAEMLSLENLMNKYTRLNGLPQSSQVERVFETQNGASWEQQVFLDKPVIADLAMLEKFKMDISEVEGGFLSAFQAQLVNAQPGIDTLDLPTN